MSDRSPPIERSAPGDASSTSHSAAEPALLFEVDGVIATLTLNRPARRNALSEQLVGELNTALETLQSNRDVRVVILQSAGGVFCSGHDLAEMTGRSPEEYDALFNNCSRFMLGLRQLRQPVIAVVQGVATGAGCQLAAACDLVVASTSAAFYTPGVKLGLFCTTPMVPLVRSIPPKIAMEMLLTGAPLSAERAWQVGLVNRLVAPEQLRETALDLARTIASASPLTLAIGKQAFYSQPFLDESLAYPDAARTMSDNAVKQDAQEGMTAFREKRTPLWTGE
jgi:enoyl-CoA hydratase/carnithine racemase